MPNQLTCNFCSKPATVHFTQIVNNQVHKVDLCEDCAQAKGITDPAGFSLSDLLLKGAATTPLPFDQQTDAATASDASASVGAAVASAAGLRCAKCGFTQADFKKYGRFGCPHCYETFAPMLAPMLEAMHKGSAHTGKVPHHAAARKTYHDRLSQLEHTLADAIKAERYEDAARYRDEITQVKQTYGKQDAAD